MNIRKDDIVEIITGDDASKPKARRTARVLRVLHDTNKVVVEGVNRVYRHLKPNRRNSQGGRLSKEMPISVSNVLLFCGSCQRGVRIGKRYSADGRKERFCKKCGNGLGALSKAREAYSEKTAEARAHAFGVAAKRGFFGEIGSGFRPVSEVES